jgi:DNA ligase D-like protein (predicted 3'-phosphoesterase)
MTDLSREAKPLEMRPIFVLQKHNSIIPHFDLRLEIKNGVLKSWTLPANPFLEAQSKTDAVLVNDHYLPWAYFEGFIHEGNYGRGPVMIWDIGILKIFKISEGLQNNDKGYEDKGSSILFEIEGKKIKGSFKLKYVNTFETFIYWSIENAGNKIAYKVDKNSLNVSALSGHSIEYIGFQTQRKQLAISNCSY